MRCIYCGCESGERSHTQDTACRRALRDLLGQVLAVSLGPETNDQERVETEVRAVLAAGPKEDEGG